MREEREPFLIRSSLGEEKRLLLPRRRSLRLLAAVFPMVMMYFGHGKVPKMVLTTRRRECPTIGLWEKSYDVEEVVLAELQTRSLQYATQHLLVAGRR